MKKSSDLQEFHGLTEETYHFFWEIAFQNHRAFYEENRERYRACVQKPLLQLAELLAPTALEIDPAFNVRPSSVVSRIRRDTRYSKDKTPYRDHAWLGFKPHEQRTSVSFVIYAEFERDAYGYGMGMYAPEPQLMQSFRNRILARPQHFLSLVNDPTFSDRFTLVGESFKRLRFQDADEKIRPWLNLRRISFQYSSPSVSRTMRPEIFDEIQEAFLLMKPVYRFLMGLD